MLLKYVFGSHNMEEEDYKAPNTKNASNNEKLQNWLVNLDVWGSYYPLST